MTIIYKYRLDIVDEQRVEMPIDSTILSVHNQDNQVMMWAKVGAIVQGNVPMHWVTIGIFGTGQELPDDIEDAVFLGTVLTGNGQLVWHVWKMP